MFHVQENNGNNNNKKPEVKIAFSRWPHVCDTASLLLMLLSSLGIPAFTAWVGCFSPPILKHNKHCCLYRSRRGKGTRRNNRYFECSVLSNVTLCFTYVIWNYFMDDISLCWLEAVRIKVGFSVSSCSWLNKVRKASRKDTAAYMPYKENFCRSVGTHQCSHGKYYKALCLLPTRCLLLLLAAGPCIRDRYFKNTPDLGFENFPVLQYPQLGSWHTPSAGPFENQPLISPESLPLLILLWLVFEARVMWVAQAGLDLDFVILLPQPPHRNLGECHHTWFTWFSAGTELGLCACLTKMLPNQHHF